MNNATIFTLEKLKMEISLDFSLKLFSKCTSKKFLIAKSAKHNPIKTWVKLK